MTIQSELQRNLSLALIGQVPEILIEVRWTERTNKMQQIRYLLSNFYLNMFRASLCPSSGD